MALEISKVSVHLRSKLKPMNGKTSCTCTILIGRTMLSTELPRTRSSSLLPRVILKSQEASVGSVTSPLDRMMPGSSGGTQ